MKRIRSRINVSTMICEPFEEEARSDRTSTFILIEKPVSDWTSQKPRDIGSEPVNPKRGEVHGYVSENDVWRISAGGTATFVPEDPLMARRHGRVAEVVQTGMRTVDLPYLASIYGGSVASDKLSDNEIRPRSGHHQVRIELAGPAVDRTVRGTPHLSGARESIASALWRRILQVLVRESSV